MDKALQANVEAIQLATWNDYGEGTMLEPTRELGYGCLTTLQQKLGVPFAQAELELVARLFELRKTVGGDGAKLAQLDHASTQLAQLRPAEARKLLDAL